MDRRSFMQTVGIGVAGLFCGRRALAAQPQTELADHVLSHQELLLELQRAYEKTLRLQAREWYRNQTNLLLHGHTFVTME